VAKVSDRVRRLRKEHGLTQEEVARRAGLTLNSYGDIERGHVRDPHLSSLEAIARALGVPIQALVNESDLFGGGWREAFDNSLRVRADAKERLRERLESWKAARDEGAGDERRRELINEVGHILDEANEAIGRLIENVRDGLDGMADPSPEETPNAYWEEVRKIDTLYRELVAMVQDAGLSVRPKTSQVAVRARHHELEASAR
jgi:transcriptional regulator with XRE-family HTH domain